MNWHAKIDQELDQLSGGGQLQQGSAVLTIDTPHGRLECDLTAVDSIGCAFTRLSLHSSALQAASVDGLQQLGQQLAQQLNYLLEPISNLELDKEGFSLQLRSNPPQRDEDQRRYYELTARRDHGDIRLCRYQKLPQQTREVIAAAVTREVFRRLAADFDTAAFSLE